MAVTAVVFCGGRSQGRDQTHNPNQGKSKIQRNTFDRENRRYSRRPARVAVLLAPKGSSSQSDAGIRRRYQTQCIDSISKILKNVGSQAQKMRKHRN